MIVKCIKTKRSEVYSEKSPDRNYHFLDSNECVTRDKRYVVYAVAYDSFSTPSVEYCTIEEHFWYGDFYYLIVDDDGDVRWKLGYLFEVVCPHFYGEGWCFRHFPNDDIGGGLQGLFGSEGMIKDPEYIDRIMLGDDTEEDRNELLGWIKRVDESMLKATCSCCPDVRAVVASNQRWKPLINNYGAIDGYWENPE